MTKTALFLDSLEMGIVKQALVNEYNKFEGKSMRKDTIGEILVEIARVSEE